MQSSRSAKVLLTIFILSVSLVSILEMGHQVLHTVKNPFHDHSTLIRKGPGSPDLQHTLEQHGFKKVRFDQVKELNGSANNFILLAFGFCDDLEEYRSSLNTSDQIHNTWFERFLMAVNSTPLTPPPLSLA